LVLPSYPDRYIGHVTDKHLYVFSPTSEIYIETIYRQAGGDL